MVENDLSFKDSEIVIGLVSPVGTALSDIVEPLTVQLKIAGYNVELIKISRDVIRKHFSAGLTETASEYERVKQLMDCGNEAREKYGKYILALGAISEIKEKRNSANEPKKRTAYIVDSLKHPEEVERFRKVYQQGFFLVGVNEIQSVRKENLVENKGFTKAEANELMERDKEEETPFGQNVIGTFHLSDFFVHRDKGQRSIKSVGRIVQVLFGNPFITPTFDEWAMFQAYTSSLRSADLSRQVGAVIAKGETIISSGSNDCPRFGGGLYWPYMESDGSVHDMEGGRDFKIGHDSNKKEQDYIIEDISRKAEEAITAISESLGPTESPLFRSTTTRIRESFQSILKSSKIGDLTEFGRVVHAEMEAILSCARSEVSTLHGTLFCTTFPCHNCAKHIVAAGINRVVFIEPYQKSKAIKFHRDSIHLGAIESDNETELKKVLFEPFVGVGPRRFFDLFSIGLGSGIRVKRKEKTGEAKTWRLEDAELRLPLQPGSYLDMEELSRHAFEKLLKPQGSEKDE